MKLVDGWWFPDHEQHLIEWMANPKSRMILNGRAAYQGAKIQHALKLVRPNTECRTAVDVGGHIGLWSYNLAPEFRAVEAFEPCEAHRECFRKNVDAMNVTLNPYALGEREGSVSLFTGPASSGDTWVKGDGNIPMRTLDSFGLRDVDFIKIDCEGYEEFVLRGAEILIGTWRPIIVVEQKRDHATKFGLKPQGAVDYLTKVHGYGVESVMSGDFFMVPA